jgi:glc operon protein GlcG
LSRSITNDPPDSIPNDPEEPALMTSRAFPRILLAVQALTFSTAAVAQERLVERPATAGVRDGAGMFSENAIRDAGESLRKIAREFGVVAVVETIANLNGEEIDEAAIRMARRSAIKGVFILIAKKEMKIEVLASRQFHDAFPRDALRSVRTAFTEAFLKKHFDRGLTDGVGVIETAAAAAKAEKRLPTIEAPVDDVGPLVATAAERPASALVVRNQVKLTLEGARAIVAAAKRQAAAMNLKSNIAIVDDGGHLLSFDRMNGARPASGYTAITKAVTAATFRQPTGPIPSGATHPDPILNIGIQNAAAASGGKITTLKGGEPVIVDGQVIGGVGVGGGTGEQDAEVARAGIDAFLKQLSSPEPPNSQQKKDETPSRAVKD